MDSIFEHLAVHIGFGAVVRSTVIASGLRYFMGHWAPWQEVLAAALSPVLLRALLGEATYLMWGERPLIAQLMAVPPVALLQFVTIRLATDHQRNKVSLVSIVVITLLAQLAAMMISAPISRTILGEP